jgi:hypothetical protein
LGRQLLRPTKHAEGLLRLLLNNLQQPLLSLLLLLLLLQLCVACGT